MMKRTFLILTMLVILTGCVRVQIAGIHPTPTPTPEMLIVRRSDPTPRANPTPYIPGGIDYMATAMVMAPQTSQTQNRPTAAVFEPVDLGDFLIEYIGNSVKTDKYTGREYVEITYRFTNNSSKTTSFILGIGRQAFQGGIEMEFNSPPESELLTDIRPGASIIVKDGYELRNDNPVVELEFRQLFDYSKTAVTRTITLK